MRGSSKAGTPGGRGDIEPGDAGAGPWAARAAVVCCRSCALHVRKNFPQGADIGIGRQRDFLVAEPCQRIEHGRQDSDVESRIDGRGQLE
jgi:hypothetical protein